MRNRSIGAIAIAIVLVSPMFVVRSQSAAERSSSDPPSQSQAHRSVPPPPQLRPSSRHEPSASTRSSDGPTRVSMSRPAT